MEKEGSPKSTLFGFPKERVDSGVEFNWQQWSCICQYTLAVQKLRAERLSWSFRL